MNRIKVQSKIVRSFAVLSMMCTVALSTHGAVAGAASDRKAVGTHAACGISRTYTMHTGYSFGSQPYLWLNSFEYTCLGVVYTETSHDSVHCVPVVYLVDNYVCGSGETHGVIGDGTKSATVWVNQPVSEIMWIGYDVCTRNGIGYGREKVNYNGTTSESYTITWRATNCS